MKITTKMVLKSAARKGLARKDATGGIKNKIGQLIGVLRGLKNKGENSSFPAADVYSQSEIYAAAKQAREISGMIQALPTRRGDPYLVERANAINIRLMRIAAMLERKNYDADQIASRISTAENDAANLIERISQDFR